ncbi:MAG: DNA mismatch repair protein MutS, partial [Lentisphaeria bacterium]|nr:DNA mismatch repair protein MutS [Lentisphaeria bacterium]
GVLDCTVTPMGGRLLRDWVLRPLYDVEGIVARLDAVDQLKNDPLTLTELRETLRGVRDLERINGRLNVGNANARDMLALAVGLGVIPGIRLLLSECDAPLLQQLSQVAGDFPELCQRITDTIAENPPVQLNDGGLIRDGFSADLDELRKAATEGKNWLSDIQAREIARTGIKSLKVKFNQVFGYYIEVSKANLASVPEDYIRKQTLVNAERFITPELKELESKILGSEEKARALEFQIFQELRAFILPFTGMIQRSAAALAQIDVLAALAEDARKYRYIRPHINDGDTLSIFGGRHPVLDAGMESGRFVPNDVLLDCDEHRMMLITGPNMAGKSTYIRQTALLVIMAQMGSFIPADSATIGIADRIFTRVGAADDLSRGQSTFMVEMAETANILNCATNRSLVILDEIGRGTSTFDGLSIAWAVAEFLHDDPVCRCRTQFATHYHELTELASIRRGINNFNVAVREYGDKIIFLRQIIPGSTDRSYGIHGAKLAGLPKPVTDRAEDMLALLDK